MRARGIESGGDSSDDDRPRYYFFIQVLCRSRGREEQCSYNKFGLENQGLSRFGGSGGVEDQYESFN